MEYPGVEKAPSGRISPERSRSIPTHPGKVAGIGPERRPNSPRNGGRIHVGTVAGFTSEQWPVWPRNGGRIASEYAKVQVHAKYFCRGIINTCFPARGVPFRTGQDSFPCSRHLHSQDHPLRRIETHRYLAEGAWHGPLPGLYVQNFVDEHRNGDNFTRQPDLLIENDLWKWSLFSQYMVHIPALS